MAGKKKSSSKEILNFIFRANKPDRYMYTKYFQPKAIEYTFILSLHGILPRIDYASKQIWTNLLDIKYFCLKFSVMLSCLFTGLWTEKTSFLWASFVCACWHFWLLVSPTFSLRHSRQKENRIHCYVVLWIPRSCCFHFFCNLLYIL